MGGRPGKGTGYLIFLLVVCGLAGGLVGEAIGQSFKALAFLKNSVNIGMPQPVVLNMRLVSLTFGINFTLNIFSLIGVLLGFFIYKKM